MGAAADGGARRGEGTERETSREAERERSRERERGRDSEGEEQRDRELVSTPADPRMRP